MSQDAPQDDAGRLETIAAEYWNTLLEQHPTFATSISVHDHDERLEDLSPESRARWASDVRGFRARCEEIDEEALDADQAVTLHLLCDELDAQRRIAGLALEEWSIDQLMGPQVSHFDLPRVHAVTDQASAESFLARVRAMPTQLAQHRTNLERGLEAGRVAARPPVERVLSQLDELLELGPGRCSLWRIAENRPAAIADEDWAPIADALRTTIADDLFPACRDYRDFIGQRIAPAARETPGLLSLEGGEAAYLDMIAAHCSVERSPQDLHELGMAEVARVRSEMEELVGEIFPAKTLAEALEILRDRTRHGFESREEIVETARRAVRRATEAARDVFSLLPDHECDVQPVDAHAEKAAPAAFYLGPAPDGSRPGTYFVNTHDPGSRPRYEAEVVAYHEAVPGHHLQIALAQQIEGVPEFQKHVHCTAYVEGWALYTERLADELSLYSGAIDRLGMLSCDAWRGSRLVVDTGLHALGWSRQRAIDYLAQNTAASMPDIEVEIDRYIAWPGQALSYKVGQVEIRRLREDAEARLGDRFDIRGFHAAVLAKGGVTLGVLAELVETWVRAQGQSETVSGTVS